MKNLKLAACCACMILCSIYSVAQITQGKLVSVNEPDYTRPKLFGDLPERINFDPANLATVFETQVGQSINIPVSPALILSGQVVSKASDQNSTSIVVRLTNRLGARFIFTKLTDSSYTTKYIGRIISLKHGDSYEIVSENSQYFFKKKGIYDLVTE